MVFTPFYLPLVGLMALFMFSYLGLCVYHPPAHDPHPSLSPL